MDVKNEGEKIESTKFVKHVPFYISFNLSDAVTVKRFNVTHNAWKFCNLTDIGITYLNFVN